MAPSPSFFNLAFRPEMAVRFVRLALLGELPRGVSRRIGWRKRLGAIWVMPLEGGSGSLSISASRYRTNPEELLLGAIFGDRRLERGLQVDARRFSEGRLLHRCQSVVATEWPESRGGVVILRKNDFRGDPRGLEATGRRGDPLRHRVTFEQDTFLLSGSGSSIDIHRAGLRPASFKTRVEGLQGGRNRVPLPLAENPPLQYSYPAELFPPEACSSTLFELLAIGIRRAADDLRLTRAGQTTGLEWGLRELLGKT